MFLLSYGSEDMPIIIKHRSMFNQTWKTKLSLQIIWILLFGILYPNNKGVVLLTLGDLQQSEQVLMPNFMDDLGLFYECQYINQNTVCQDCRGLCWFPGEGDFCKR